MDDRLTDEWYYSHGIAATFERDRLASIVLSPDVGGYSGFLAYSGETIHGLKLTDSKKTVLKKLGKPTKVEEDPLPEGTNPEAPVVWPKESRYYWRLTDYTVEVGFLNQAQNLNDALKLTRPKDSVTVILIKK